MEDNKGKDKGDDKNESHDENLDNNDNGNSTDDSNDAGHGITEDMTVTDSDINMTTRRQKPGFSEPFIPYKPSR